MTDTDYMVEGEPIPPVEPPAEYSNGRAGIQVQAQEKTGRPPQVAAGENPLHGATDISQGRELTPERGLKNRAPARAHSSSSLHPPPVDLEAEDAVLGSMMISEKARTDCLELLKPEDFFTDRHRKIFEAIADSAADPIIVAARLGPFLESVGGKVYLAALTASVPTASNASYYAKIVQEKAAQRNVITQATIAVQGIYDHDWPAEKARETLSALPVAVQTNRRLKSAVDFLSSAQELRAAWGKGDEILWAAGEPCLITSITGLGKTTLAHRLMLARIGFGQDTVLDYPVSWDERPLLYIAADRPNQAKVSLRRMVRLEDYGALDGRLIVHEGPLDFDISRDPDRLVSYAMSVGAGGVVLDSLKDVAMDLEKPEGGVRVARAFQLVVAEGIDLLALHHDRKHSDGRTSGKAPRSIDDVFGSTWITAVCGSVISLWGQPGDPVVGFKQLKMPASEVNAGQVLMDFDLGKVEWFRKPDAYVLIHAAPGGLTAQACARGLFGAENPSPNQVEKARRQLAKLEREGKAVSKISGVGRDEIRTFYAVDHYLQEA